MGHGRKRDVPVVERVVRVATLGSDDQTAQLAGAEDQLVQHRQDFRLGDTGEGGWEHGGDKQNLVDNTGVVINRVGLGTRRVINRIWLGT